MRNRARHTLKRLLFCSAVVGTLTFAAGPVGAQATKTACDRACLNGVMDGYVKAMAAHTPAAVPLATGAIIRENTKAIALDASAWQTIAAIKSITNFADPQTGNIVSRVAAETKDGKLAYIGTRLKVAGKRITEIETSFNDRAVAAANVLVYDPLFDTIVPAEKRGSRASLERIVLAYFDALGSHKPDPADYDTRCDRFSSGTRVTRRGGGPGGRRGGPPAGPNGAPPPPGAAPPPAAGEGRGTRPPIDADEAATNSAEIGCLESIQGNPPWLQAIEQRVPVVDTERGIAIGYTLLLYPNDRAMLISEVFKVLDGRFRLIDYIGIVDTGIKTTGFQK